MREKPIIGIVAKPELDNEGWNLMYTNEHIKEAIVFNGGLVIGIIPQGKAIGIKQDLNKYDYELEKNELMSFYSVLEICDGFILEGGYIRCKYEQEVAKYAYENDIPILGICSGHGNQVLALGGNNIQIKNDNGFHNNHKSEYVHDINIKKDSKFFNIIGKEKIRVNSYHKKIPYETGVYDVVGVSEDGLNEVVEIKNKLFNIGVKFHPELLFKKDENMNNIFKEFVKATVEYKNRNEVKIKA